MRWVLVILTLFFAARAAGVTTIELRPSAALPVGGVLVGDVADVSGDEAARLSAIEVLESAPASGVVRLDDVREALDAAGVNWGRVALRGGECRVRAGAPRLARVESDSNEDAADAEPGVVDLSGPETPRTRIARMLASLYGVENTDLRLRFEQRDHEFLISYEPGRRYEARVEASRTSERVPVMVTVFEGERVAETRTVRVDARVRTRALVLTRDLDRGDRIEADAFRPQERWVSPSGSPVIVEAGAALGQLARTRLGTGTVLRDAHLERPVLIKRNDLATVHCLAGSVSVRVEARAMDEGREGDVIEFRVDRESEPFRARVSGAGIAVAVTQTTHDSQQEAEEAAR